MQRRTFLAGLGAALATPAMSTAATTKPAIFELRTVQLRNTTDNMVQRTSDFLKNSYLPALQRAGANPVGAFTNLIGPGGPQMLLLMSFSSVDAWEASAGKLEADKDYGSHLSSYTSGALGYVRMESSLFRAFEAMPQIEVPSTEGRKGGRVFELRTYESNNSLTLARKVKMFADGEIALFRKLGMTPVFFGQCIAGRNMPNLTYMLAYDDLATREKVWSAFASSPEWQKMKSQPGVSDGEIVSNISNTMLRGLPFSPIR